MSLISGFGLTLCFLINNTMPYLPLVASVKISKSLSVIGFVFLSTSAHESNFERQTVLFFSCLGFFVSISFNIADACNLCCFFDGTCHFCGFDVQVWLLPSLTSCSIYHTRPQQCLQLPLTLKINRNLVLNTWSLRLYFSANNPASEFTLDKMLVQSFQMDLGFISKGTFSYSRKTKVLVSKYSKNNHQYSIYNQNSRLRLKKRYIYVTYETDQ